MARTKDTVPSIATFDLTYDEPGAIDWQEVEKSVGVEFDEVSRQEIIKCAVEFSAAKALQEQAPTFKGVRELREQLIVLAGSVIQLDDEASEWVHPRDKSDEKLAKESAFTALSLAYSDHVSLRDALKEMADAGRVLKGLLDAEPAYSLDKSALEPMTAALSAFISIVLTAARGHRARGNHAWIAEEAFEFERWGISIGPQSTQCLKFCRALFGEEIKSSSLKVAFKHMRENIHRKHPHFSLLKK